MKEIFIDNGVFAIIAAENEFLIDVEIASRILGITQEQYKKYIYPIVDDKSTNSSAENYGHFLTKYRESMEFLTIKLPEREIFIDAGTFNIITAEYEGVIPKDRACCMLDMSRNEYDEYIIKRLELGEADDGVHNYVKWTAKYEEYKNFFTIKIFD